MGTKAIQGRGKTARVALDCFAPRATTTKSNSALSHQALATKIRKAVQRETPASASIASLTAAANWPADAANIKRDSS